MILESTEIGRSNRAATHYPSRTMDEEYMVTTSQCIRSIVHSQPKLRPTPYLSIDQLGISIPIPSYCLLSIHE